MKALATIAAAVALLTPCAPAQTYHILYQFTGAADGSQPVGTVLLHGSNLYGVTYFGGASGTSAGCGTVYQLNVRTGLLTTLHNFAGAPSDGCAPSSGVIRDSAGNLYGTTTNGGANDLGMIYRIDTSNTLTILHSFSGLDGQYPIGLVLDSAGDLFGATSAKGLPNRGSGTVFRLSSPGTFTTLHRFDQAGDGEGPVDRLILMNGNLYGVTAQGGTGCTLGCGTVFEVNATTGQEKVLYNFTGGSDGGLPFAGVISDGQGNLYGTASEGGSAPGDLGYGVIYELNIATGQQTALYTFTGGSDGGSPDTGLVRDAQGNLYGDNGVGGLDSGVIFKLDTSGNLTTLHSFAVTGARLPNGLTMDKAGNLYGSAESGGKYFDGSVFKLTP